MRRPIVPYEPTWLDRSFRKELDSLTGKEREACLSQLADLLGDLQLCNHPILDPNLKKWRPTPYKGVVPVQGGHLAEYRLTRTMRVIAGYFTERNEILLVVATVKHDHERLKRLLREHGRHLASFLDE